MTLPTCHDPANALLPWLVNGTLEGAEDVAVRAHLATCPICASEVRELSELADLARAAVQAKARSRRSKWAAIAASIVLPVIIGVGWVATRRTAAPPPVVTGDVTAKLDLGAGPVRGGVTEPHVLVSPGVGHVAISVLLPVVVNGPLEMQLRSGSGEVLSRSPAGGDCSRGAGCTFTVPAALVSKAGSYALVLVETGSSTEGGYSYPFVVER